MSQIGCLYPVVPSRTDHNCAQWSYPRMDANIQWSPYRAAYWLTVLSGHIPIELTAMSIVNFKNGPTVYARMDVYTQYISHFLERAYCAKWLHARIDGHAK